MTSIDLRAIENTTKRKHKGQLYWAIQELTHTSKEADAICRDHEIYADAKLEKDRALLMAKLGPCMDDWLLARLCRREVPLVVQHKPCGRSGRAIHRKSEIICARDFC